MKCGVECDKCSNYHVWKSDKFNRCFALCSFYGWFDTTIECKHFEERKEGYTEVVEEITPKVETHLAMTELFWGLDAQLNLCNPDYGKDEKE